MHDHEHDLGLLHDLATMERRWSLPRAFDRRDALRVLGAAGAGLVLVACGKKSNDNGANATTTTVTTAGATGATTRAPSETGGPFPADGTNGPNVLAEDSGVVRRDITKSFGQYSGTASGVPLTMTLTVVHAATGVPYAGAAVYAWHCDAQGRYSLYSQGATSQNYCRGVQAVAANGDLTFASVFPAAYSGRWPHVHYEVFPSLSATSAGSRLLTSQIALTEAECNAVYADSAAYPDSARNMQQTSLKSDMVFADSYQTEMAQLSGSPSSGYTMTFTVAV